MNEEPCGTRNFEEQEEEIIALTKDTFKRAYPIYWFGLEIVKDVINLLINDATNEKDNNKGKYSTAFLLLFNRSIQHIESIRLLTERGLYGNAFVLIRSLMSDLSMMQYLHFRPELLDLFLNENQEDYQENKEFRKAFSERVIETELVERGVKPFGSSFQILSKASHSSSFGSQLFGSRGKIKNQYHFKYGPKFQPELAIMLIDMVASSYYDLVNNVLWHRHHTNEDISTQAWDKIKEDLRKLKEDVNIHSEATIQTIKSMWPEGLN